MEDVEEKFPRIAIENLIAQLERNPRVVRWEVSNRKPIDGSFAVSVMEDAGEKLGRSGWSLFRQLVLMCMPEATISRRCNVTLAPP